MLKRKDKREHTELMQGGDGGKKPNAWKRYGAIAMAAVLLAGTAALYSGNSEANEVQAEEETETRITLNMASDNDKEEAPEEEEGAEALETEMETETETEVKEVFDPIENVETSKEAAIVTTDVSEMVENCMPSIVSITMKSVEEIQTYYNGIQEYESEGAASGIIIAQNDEELLIATNSHVVDGANELNVCFTAEAEDSDDLIVPGKVKGMDKDYELAVVAVQLSDIPAEIRSQLKIARLGSSGDLKVGQAAVAIGNALGYGQNVTCGIISALNREVTIDNFTKELIVTDAAINFGNSGGALLNAKGEVIGINVAKEVGDGSESMGYSIPIDTAVPVLQELVNRETRDKIDNLERGYMGATVVNVSDEAKTLYDMPQGAYVSEVAKGSAAEDAGIRKGDVITKFDGITVTSSDDLIDKMGYYAVGETVRVEIQRANGGEYEAQEVEVTLQEASEDVKRQNQQSQQDAGDSQDDDRQDRDNQDGQENGDDDMGDIYDFFQQFPFGDGSY